MIFDPPDEPLASLEWYCVLPNWHNMKHAWSIYFQSEFDQASNFHFQEIQKIEKQGNDTTRKQIQVFGYATEQVTVSANNSLGGNTSRGMVMVLLYCWF